MAKNTLQDLRDHLFSALESLADEEKPMDIERAKAICSVSEKIIDSARVEVKYLEVAGDFGDKTRFFGDSKQLPAHGGTGRTLPS